MVEDDKQMYNERIACGTHTGAFAADETLCALECTQDAKLEAIEIAAEEANWFDLIVRTKKVDNITAVVTYADTELKKRLRLNGDGQLIYEESFEKPIMTMGARVLESGYTVTKECIIIPVDAATALRKYAASMKIWERRGL